MKTPNPDVGPFVAALRGDLPSAADEARVRARLLAAGVVVTSAALSTSSAALSTSSAASSLGGAASTGAGVSGAIGGLGAGAPAALVKAGLLSKVLVLPVAAKVGMAATLAVAVAATSVPLVLEHRETAASAVPADRAAQVPPALERAPEPSARGRVEVPALDQAPLRAVSAASSEATSASGAPGAGAVPGMAASLLEASQAAASKVTAPQVARIIARAGSEGTKTNGAPIHSIPGGLATRTGSAPARAGSEAAAARGASRPASGGERQAPAASDTTASDTTASDTAAGGRTELVRASSLAEETRLMEQAMAALGEGDRALAQRSLEEHARRFPGGLLQRERERALARLRQAASQPAQPPATDSSR